MTHHRVLLITAWAMACGAPALVLDSSLRNASADGGKSESGADGGLGDAGITRVSYQADIVPIWARHCASCHAGVRPQVGLDLLAPGSASQLKSKVMACLVWGTGQLVDVPLVVPGTLEGSALWLKVSDLPGATPKPGEIVCNREMPPTSMGGLKLEAPSDYAKVEAWILQGAHD